MKTLICFAILVVATAASGPFEALPAEVLGHFDTCQKEHKVSDELVKKVKLHDFSFDDDQAGQCFVKCVGLSIGFMDDEFKLITDKFEKKYTTIDAEKVMK